jgi:hypothetical protein
MLLNRSTSTPWEMSLIAIVEGVAPVF